MAATYLVIYISDTNAINSWIYEHRDRPSTQAQAYSAICSLLEWIGMELINNGEGSYGNIIKSEATKFG